MSWKALLEPFRFLLYFVVKEDNKEFVKLALVKMASVLKVAEEEAEHSSDRG